MPSMEPTNHTGLSSRQVAELQRQFGKNEAFTEKKQSFLKKLLDIISEPMFLLLLAAAVIYFLLGEAGEGAIMLVFVVGIISIDVLQEWKTDKTLRALKALSAPHIEVIRDGKKKSILSADLVPGDSMLLFEGIKIPADGKIISANDLCVDESSLTGESEAVWKTEWSDAPRKEYWRKDRCYAGTLVLQGNAVVLIESIGRSTEYGKIGNTIAEAPDRPTPLEKQIKKIVKISGIFAAAFCLLALTLTYLKNTSLLPKERLITSILSGITLAMGIIPEEFPVILAVFLSMGAWRLAKKQSLIRRLPAVETLGAISVLCVDKTGTLTKNNMSVAQTWSPSGDYEQLHETMGLACEKETYDPMEKAMLAFCAERGISREHLFESRFVSEFAFTNEGKMMGHVWVHEDRVIVAAKGSPESILPICNMPEQERMAAAEKAENLSADGLRVIAVAHRHLRAQSAIPSTLPACELHFDGLIGLTDPPRDNIKENIASCLRAGVRVIMITGDNGITAQAIAQQVGIPGETNICTGAELSALSDEQLQQRVKTVNIFSRVLPEHKMRIVQALKAGGEIVAMTGDGVNDAPALKFADIGIAMGQRGSEVSREAADLVLLDDNFATIVDTICDGRRIFENIRKAIGYVFTMHLPIALAALFAPLLGVGSEAVLLLPLHVVLLELIIDPTCSIVLERQPAEADCMRKPPRDPKANLLSRALMIKSVLQGLVIFFASFGLYYFTWRQSNDSALARSMGLSVLFLANLLLVQVNSSNTQVVSVSIRFLMKDRVMQIVTVGTLLGMLVILYTPLAGFLKLAPLPAAQLLLVLGVSAASVLWYEAVKLMARKKAGNH